MKRYDCHPSSWSKPFETFLKTFFQSSQFVVDGNS